MTFDSCVLCACLLCRYVRGEGAVAMRLVRLAEGERVRAIACLESTVINQDGPSSALTAPNGPSQMAALRSG